MCFVHFETAPALSVKEDGWIDGVFKAPSWSTDRTTADPSSLKRAAPDILERSHVKAAKHVDHDDSVSDAIQDETPSPTTTVDENGLETAAAAPLEDEHSRVPEQCYPTESNTDTDQEQTSVSSSTSDDSAQITASPAQVDQSPSHVSEASDGKDQTTETDPDQNGVATQTNEKSDLKRAAPTPLEQGRTKAAKLDDRNGSTGKTDNDPIIVEQISDAEAITRLEKRLANANEAAKRWSKEKNQFENEIERLSAENERLRALGREIKDDRDMLRLKLCEVEEKADVGKNKGNGKSRSEKLDLDIRQKYEKRIKDQKNSHEEKYEGLKTTYQQKSDEIKQNHEKNKAKLQKRLDERDEKHKDAIQDLKDKHSALQKAKDDAHQKRADELTKKTNKQLDEMKDKLKDATEDHKETQQALKEKHKTELNKYRPEHSGTVKKKDEDIKAYLQEISDVEKALEESKQEINTLKGDLAEMTSEKYSLDAKLREAEVQKQHTNYLLSTRDHEYLNLMRENSKVRQDMNTQLKDQTQEFITQFKNRLAEEGRKWQVQYDKAEGLQRERTDLHKANIYLRNSADRKAERIQALMQSNQDLERSLREAWARVDKLSSNLAPAITDFDVPDNSAIDGVRESIEDNTGVGNLGQGQAEM